MSNPILRFSIIGLAQSGKTTLFNALTGARLPTGPGAVAREPHPGIAKVPDQRLEALAKVCRSRKIVPAELEFLDFPGSLKAYTRDKGSGAGYLTDLAQVDALVFVVRAFSQDNVAHELGSVDSWRDLETIQFELAFADIMLMDRRLERIRDSAGKAKPQEREAMEKDRTLLSRLKEGLEKGTPLRAQEINEQEEKLLRAYQLLTSKPVLAVLNIGEEGIDRAPDLEFEARQRLGSGLEVVAVPCQTEMEMTELEPAEADEFRASLGIQGRPLQRLLQLGHNVTNRFHFLTTGPDESRAWPLVRGATAQQAAGVIHTDLERGFIRAEVINWEDLVRCGSLVEARRRGLIRAEGKAYRVQDGDVLNVLFHV